MLRAKLRNILHTPVNSSFTISKRGARGYKSHGHVILMMYDFNFPVSLYIPLRERLRTNKVFTKDQCFYLNYHKFSIKSYVLDVY